MTDISKRRRWLRYSLLTLLVLVVLTGTGMRWIAKRLQRSMRQHEAVEAILESGGGAKFDFEIDQAGNPLPKASPPGPSWVRYLIGDEISGNVVEAEVKTDLALEGIKDLPLLRRLHLFSTGITDAGLQHLKQSPQLNVLFIEKTKVTEQGIEKLQKALPNCRVVR